MYNSSNTRVSIAINITFVLLAAALLNSFINYKSYTLEKNGHWKSSKTNLKGVNGVYANMFTKAALCKNHLNIAAWFGYQELIYYKPAQISALRFNFHSGDFPFSLILDKTDSLTTGIYFHYKRDSTCCLFVADKEGKFLSKQLFYDRSSWQLWRWNNMELNRAENSIKLKINNQLCLQTPVKLPDTTHFGFRGGRFQALVDDVVVCDARGDKIVRETFDAPFSLNWQTVIFTVAFLILLFSFHSSSHRSLLTAFNMSVVLGFIACYLLYFFYLSYLYPTNIDFLKQYGRTVTFEVEDSVCNRLRTQYTNTQNKPVVLFIGSSQTWGAGTSSPQHTYPALVEKNLRNYFHDSAITVINSGLCGATSDRLYRHYSEEWYKVHPLLTVIDLSHNDFDTVIFRQQIRKFLAFNQAKKIRTLLIAEPNDHYRKRLKINHRILKEEGDRFNVVTVPMQAYMDSMYDSGFLWWDWVHMTDYGYRKFSERITPFVVNELERDSLLYKFNKVNDPETYRAGQSHSP